MSSYVRWYSPGGTYFFTLVTERRAPIFADDSARALLRAAIDRCREDHPFDIPAMVLLDDHLHLMMQLPDDDHDFSIRLRWIKSNFTAAHLDRGGVEQARTQRRIDRGSRGVWQRRFYEHLCRDDRDVANHIDYIHFNPVEHAYVDCPHAYASSSFHRWVKEGWLKHDWRCACGSTSRALPNFSWASNDME